MERNGKESGLTRNNIESRDYIHMTVYIANDGTADRLQQRGQRERAAGNGDPQSA